MTQKHLADLKFKYCGTITFNGSYDYEKKLKAIESISKRLSTYLLFSKNNRYVFEQVVEYHKVDNVDDYESPHVHFILHGNFKICRSRYDAICKMLSDYYGRSQFYLASYLKYSKYSGYIMKDVKKNNDGIGIPDLGLPEGYHHRLIDLNEVRMTSDYFCSECYGYFKDRIVTFYNDERKCEEWKVLKNKDVNEFNVCFCKDD